ncbi:hypothetical protein HK103_003312 [Boothiomyces macroporosus]|uniref:Uncharacterized protein n=1 Tax=Boothiomyces macroporosus TaxID=261099 RepID=A0AAD5UKC2_9FUNG|nr:hypothetical protein HK103_003312 [Boothiomyces macroporosus]
MDSAPCKTIFALCSKAIMGHEEKCICNVCTCGRHKLCKPVHLTDAHIDAHTEYGDHFLSYPTQVVRGKPAPQELSVGGDFYGSTENREKFVLHALGPRYQIVKPAYQPNTAKLESLTTQRDNYQPWPGVTPPKRRQQPKWQSTSGTFDGTTTTKSDYVEMELPAKYVRKQQPYVKSEDKMDSVSTQGADYKPWQVTSIPTRRKTIAAPPRGPEDRDFRSTTDASYVAHQPTRELVKAPQNLTTDHNSKFEGSSTAKDAYQAWQIPPRYQRHRAKYTPSTAEFNGDTTYSNTYVPKTAERYIHPTPTYVPNMSKFEGKSTNKSDYMSPGKQSRVVDFSPRNVYVPTADDRDFLSTTRRQHDPKPLAQCEASQWMGQPRQHARDGHVHLVRPNTVAVDH